MDIRYYPGRRLDVWLSPIRFERFSITENGSLSKSNLDEKFEKRVRRHAHIIETEKKTIEKFREYMQIIEEFGAWLKKREPRLFLDKEDEGNFLALKKIFDEMDSAYRKTAKKSQAKIPRGKIKDNLEVAIRSFEANDFTDGSDFLDQTYDGFKAEISRIDRDIIARHEKDIMDLLLNEHGARLSAGVTNMITGFHVIVKVHKYGQHAQIDVYHPDISGVIHVPKFIPDGASADQLARAVDKVLKREDADFISLLRKMNAYSFKMLDESVVFFSI